MLTLSRSDTAYKMSVSRPISDVVTSTIVVMPCVFMAFPMSLQASVMVASRSKRSPISARAPA